MLIIVVIPHLSILHSALYSPIPKVVCVSANATLRDTSWELLQAVYNLGIGYATLLSDNTFPETI